MQEHNPRKLKRIAGFGCAALLALLACSVVCAALLPAGSFPALQNFIELNRIRFEVNAAKSRWESHQIVDYDIDFEGNAFSMCFIAYTDQATLHVRDGKFVTATAAANRVITDTANWLKACRYADYLPAQMLEHIEQAVNKMNPAQSYLHVSFDPEYGFVTSSQSGCYFESDCDATLKFSNFRPIQNK